MCGMISFNCGNISLLNTVHHHVKMWCIMFSSSPSVHSLGGAPEKKNIPSRTGRRRRRHAGPMSDFKPYCPYLTPPSPCHALTALAQAPSPPALQRVWLELSRPTWPATRLRHTHSPGASPASVTDTSLVVGQSRVCVRSSRFLVVAWWP